MVRVETYETYEEPLVQTMYGQICGSICPMQRKSKAKQKWAIETPKLDNARQLHGIFTLVESWTFRCQQQCLVKPQ